MGLSNRVQAVLVGISAGLGAFGTAAAVIPDFVPVEYKVPIAVTSWLAGIVGFQHQIRLRQRSNRSLVETFFWQNRLCHETLTREKKVLARTLKSLDGHPIIVGNGHE
jgi:hypothetical protein